MTQHEIGRFVCEGSEPLQGSESSSSRGACSLPSRVARRSQRGEPERRCDSKARLLRGASKSPSTCSRCRRRRRCSSTTRSINTIYASNDLDEEQDFLSVIDAIQGEGFNPLWHQVLIVFNAGFTPHQFTSEDEVLAAAAGADPEMMLVPTDEVYRCSTLKRKRRKSETTRLQARPQEAGCLRHLRLVRWTKTWSRLRDQTEQEADSPRCHRDSPSTPVIFITLPIGSRACVQPLWRAKHAESEQDKPKEVQHG